MADGILFNHAVRLPRRGVASVRIAAQAIIPHPTLGRATQPITACHKIHVFVESRFIYPKYQEVIPSTILAYRYFFQSIT